MADITAATVAQTLVSGWVFRFGVPSTITTDRGSQFKSTLWSNLMKLLGTTRIQLLQIEGRNLNKLSGNDFTRNDSYPHYFLSSTSKWLNRAVQSSFKRAQSLSHSWSELLPLVLLGIRTAIKENLQFSTAELVYGTTLRLPGELISPSPVLTPSDHSDYITRLRSFMAQLKATSRTPGEHQTFIHPSLSTSTHVFVRRDSVKRPLQRPYDGPYKILNRTDKYFTIDSVITSVSID